MNETRAIRAIALGLPVRDGHVLVNDDIDKVKNQPFHRAIGGGIEFGEASEAALRREFKEELGVELDRADLLRVTENIFEYEGEYGHEIAFIYAVQSEGIDAIPLSAELSILDQPDLTIRWVPFEDEWPLYPEGIREILQDLR